MSFVNWMIDSLASEDVIDAVFILTDLFDINLTEAEICEGAGFDSLASATVQEGQQSGRGKGTPIGKQVW